MSSRLSVFKISILSSGGASANAPYANGRQQVTINVDVMKVDANNDPEKLTQKELETLTILPLSTELRPKQAQGWSCDTAPNKYDQGVRGASLLAAASDDRAEETGETGDSSPGENIFRYMRFDPAGTSIRPFVFMACITLDDGRQYSTNFDDNDQQFNSKVTLTPREPYRLGVRDLLFSQEVGFSEEWGKNKKIDVAVFYWRLPSGLSIMENKSQDILYNSDKAWYLYSKNESNFFVGAIVLDHVIDFLLKDLMIPRYTGGAGLPSWVTQTYGLIRLVMTDRSAMRVVRYAAQGQTTPSPYGRQNRWSIIDNYGCESRFLIGPDVNNKGYTPTLSDA